MVSGTSGSRNSGISSDGAVVTAVLGTVIAAGTKSEGGTDGTPSIDPVGSFFLGFGRGFFVGAAGSANAPSFDVEATALSVMAVLADRGLGRGGSVTFGGGGWSGCRCELRSRGKMEVEIEERTFWAKEIFLVFRVRNEVGQSHFTGEGGACKSKFKRVTRDPLTGDFKQPGSPRFLSHLIVSAPPSCQCRILAANSVSSNFCTHWFRPYIQVPQLQGIYAHPRYRIISSTCIFFLLLQTIRRVRTAKGLTRGYPETTPPFIVS